MFQIITGILLEELIRRADLILQGCKFFKCIKGPKLFDPNHIPTRLPSWQQSRPWSVLYPPSIVALH